jgi:hypothetical protein
MTLNVQLYGKDNFNVQCLDLFIFDSFRQTVLSVYIIQRERRVSRYSLRLCLGGTQKHQKILN